MKARQKPGIVFQPQVHETLQRGIFKMVSALRPTLGPMSGGVAMDHLNKTKSLPEFLDDGGVIARRIIELPNRDEDMGAMLVRSMILRQHETIGDGTATVAVLFEAIFNGGLRYIAAGGNAMHLRRQLESALPLILKALDDMAFPLTGRAALAGMAHSLCHDDEVADALADAFDLLGQYGRLEIRDDYGRGLRREDVEGSYFYSGLFSKALAPDEASGGYTVMENPAIFLCDFEIEDHRDLFPLLQAAHAGSVSDLVIIARNMSEKATALLSTNNKMGKFRTIAIKLPGLNPTDRMAALDDLSLMTGAVPFLSITGDSLKNVTVKHLGHARRLWTDMHAFGMVGGRGDPRRIRQHLRRLKASYHSTRKADERKTLLARIGNLLGRSIILHVGGFTETEIKARKSLADRTALAMRVGLEEGIVAGGGIALLNCRKVLEDHLDTVTDTDMRAAYRILMKALAAPAQTIFQNAGYEPGSVMAQFSHGCAETGFDVITRQVVNVCEAGILDSVIVLKTSVRNAISTAAIALTIDSLIHLAQPEMIGNPQ